MLRVVVFVSGFGSNLQALIDASHDSTWPASIEAVLSDNPSAYALTRAKQAGIAHHAYAPDTHRLEDKLSADAKRYAADLIVLAGFMRILSAQFIAAWHGRIINIHPSLLPKYRGLHTHQRVLQQGDDIHGATVHYVTAALDAGPPIIQGKLCVQHDDTVETLKARVQQIEHCLLPQAIQRIAEGATCFDTAHVAQPIDVIAFEY